MSTRLKTHLYTNVLSTVSHLKGNKTHYGLSRLEY